MPRPSFHATCISALLSEGGDGYAGSEAFDEFDQLYTSNNFKTLQKIKKMADDGIPFDQIPAKLQEDNNISELRSRELVSFYELHTKQLSQRLAESTELNELRSYGGWLSPSGKEFPVISAQAHEKEAQNILGDVWDELQGQGEDASGILGKRGWARLVHQGQQTLVDMDTNARLTTSQRRYLEDLGIENDVDVVLDQGPVGRYLYQAERR